MSGEKSAIDTAAQNTSNDINTGSVSFNPDLVSKAVSSPTSISSDPNQLQGFLKQWNASYTGPQSFETSNNYTGAATAANDAKEKAAETSSPGGQQQLISDQFGVYGQGNKNLDQALLSQSSANPLVQQKTKDFNSIQDYLGNAANTTNALIPQAQTNTQQAQDLTRNQFNTGVSNLGIQVGNETQTVKTGGHDTANNPAANLFSTLPVNPDDSDLSIAGMTRGEYEGLIKAYYPNFVPTSSISNPLYGTNPKYSQDLAQYLAAQNLQKQALASQI